MPKDPSGAEAGALRAAGRPSFRLLPASATSSAARLLWARSLRALADGFVSIILPVYLLRLGYTAVEVGVLATATLLGSAALALVAGALTPRFHHRELFRA